MIARIVSSFLFTAVLCCWASSNALAAGIAVNDTILPGSASMRFEEKPGKSTAARNADQLKINWPAKVQKVNGQWLQISDEGGYTLAGTKPASGWVRKCDVVTLDSALSAYTSAIATASANLATAKSKDDTKKYTKELARLYWLRGIYWETGDKKSVGAQSISALADYTEATELDGKVADAWLRRGRMLARLDVIGKRIGWEASFLSAFRQFSDAPTNATTCGCGKCPVCNPATPATKTPCDDGNDSLATIPGVSFSKKCPPQLYLDIGSAFEGLYIAYQHIPVDDLFEQSFQLFEWAGCINPNWYQPPSAKGDLFLARIDKTLVTDPGGQPTNWVSTDDLFDALYSYDGSIRLNDQFPRALLGRAEALGLLANSPYLLPPSRIPVDWRFRGLLAGDGDAKNAVVDMAYDSAKAASFAGKDRDPASLKILGDVQVVRAYAVQGNISFHYLAEASETFKQARLYSQSTTDRNNLNHSAYLGGVQSAWVLAYLESDADVQFAKVRVDAEDLECQIDLLFGQLGSLDVDTYPNLAHSITSAHRALLEIKQLATEGEKAATCHSPSLIRAFEWLVAPAPRPSTTTPAPQSKASAPEPWASELTTPAEALRRLERIKAWSLILTQFGNDVSDARRRCPNLLKFDP